MNFFRTFSILLLLSALVFSFSNAQIKFQAGVTTRLTLSSASIYSPSTVNELSSLAGFMGGAMVEVGFNDQLSLQTEIHYGRKAARTKQVYGPYTLQEDLFLTSFDVPVLLKLNFLPGTISPHIMMGPDFGFFRKVLINDNINGPNLNTSTWGNYTDSLESNNVSLDFGTGVDIAMADQMTLLVDLRYSLGLKDIGRSLPGTGLRTEDLQLVVGAKYAF